MQVSEGCTAQLGGHGLGFPRPSPQRVAPQCPAVGKLSMGGASLSQPSSFSSSFLPAVGTAPNDHNFVPSGHSLRKMGRLVSESPCPGGQSF